jgi:hypothetical protein
MELAERPAWDRSGSGKASSSRSFAYVTVGHVTVDVMTVDGARRPGGGAFYSALQAARLGLRSMILTQGAPHEIEALLEPYHSELALQVIPAPASTTLATSGSGAERTQRMLAWAGPITETIAVDTQILHLAPVARETSATWRGQADFVGFTPQGLARAWGEDGEIVPAPLPSDESSLSALLPDSCSAVVISEHEHASLAPLLTAASASGAVLAITAGAGATTVHMPAGGVAGVRAPAIAHPRDDLGAGDVFAAAFFIALREGHSPARAASYGNAAAAIRIQGTGADAIGDRSAIEAQLARQEEAT